MKPLHPDDPQTPLEWMLDAALTFVCFCGAAMVLAYIFDPQLLRPIWECLR